MLLYAAKKLRAVRGIEGVDLRAKEKKIGFGFYVLIDKMGMDGGLLGSRLRLLFSNY